MNFLHSRTGVVLALAVAALTAWLALSDAPTTHSPSNPFTRIGAALAPR